MKKFSLPIHQKGIKKHLEKSYLNETINFHGCTIQSKDRYTKHAYMNNTKIYTLTIQQVDVTKHKYVITINKHVNT